MCPWVLNPVESEWDRSGQRVKVGSDVVPAQWQLWPDPRDTLELASVACQGCSLLGWDDQPFILPYWPQNMVPRRYLQRGWQLKIVHPQGQGLHRWRIWIVQYSVHQPLVSASLEIHWMLKTILKSVQHWEWDHEGKRLTVDCTPAYWSPGYSELDHSSLLHLISPRSGRGWGHGREHGPKTRLELDE